MDRKGIDSTFLDESSYLFYVIVQRLPEEPGRLLLGWEIALPIFWYKNLQDSSI